MFFYIDFLSAFMTDGNRDVFALRPHSGSTHWIRPPTTSDYIGASDTKKWAYKLKGTSTLPSDVAIQHVKRLMPWALHTARLYLQEDWDSLPDKSAEAIEVGERAPEEL
jgi:hypothetical protein